MSSAVPTVVAPKDQIQKPNENDVLCGRGGSINSHAGNENFRRLVEARKRVYLTARFKREKRLIASSIVSEIRHLNPPGRFLAKRGPKNAGYWYDIGDEKARDKTSQALRENAPSIRAEIESEVNSRRKKEGKEIKTIAPTSAEGGSDSVTSATTSQATAPVPTPSAAPAPSPPPKAPPQAPPSNGFYPHGHPPPHTNPHAAAWADYYARYARYYGHYPTPPAHAPYPHYPHPHAGAHAYPPQYPPSSPYVAHQPHQPWGQPPPAPPPPQDRGQDDSDKKPAASSSPAPPPAPTSGWTNWNAQAPVAASTSAHSSRDAMDDASDYSSDAHELDVDDELEKAASLSPRRQQEEQDHRLALSLYHQEQMEAVDARRRRHDAGPRSRRTSRSSAYAPSHMTAHYGSASSVAAAAVGEDDSETFAPLAAPAPDAAAAASVAAAPPARKPISPQELQDHRMAVALQDKEDQALSRQRQAQEHSSRRTFVSSAYHQVRRHHLADWGGAEQEDKKPMADSSITITPENGIVDPRERQIHSSKNPSESSLLSQVTNHILGSLGSWDPNAIASGMCTADGTDFAPSRPAQLPQSAPVAANAQMAIEPEGHEVQLTDVREEIQPSTSYGDWPRRVESQQSWEQDTSAATNRTRRSLADPTSVSIFHSTSNTHHNPTNTGREDSINSRLNSTIGSFGDSSGSGRSRSGLLNAYGRHQQNQQMQQFQQFGISPVNSMDMTMDGSGATNADSVGGGSLVGVFDKDLSTSNNGMPHPRVLQQVPSWERSMRSKSPSASYGTGLEEDDSHMIHVRSRYEDYKPPPDQYHQYHPYISSHSGDPRVALPELDEVDVDVDHDDSMMDWESHQLE